MKRVESLDYFRGLMALSIMIFHYSSWYQGAVSPNYLLGKLGIYAVSAFYILSGLSLAIVYIRTKEKFNLTSYTINRIFRILPLFALCLSVSLLFKFVDKVLIHHADCQFNMLDIFLNYTLLFGFFKPYAYFSIGSWSIGNEVVFYTLFPLMVFMIRKKSGSIAWISLALTFFLYLYFSFFVLTPLLPLSKQWHSYVNPLNHCFLFFSGIFIGYFFSPINMIFKTRLTSFSILLLLIILFSFIEVGTNEIDLVTNWNRVILTFLMISIVLNIYLTPISIDGIGGWVLETLGKCCYSIYLIHPLVSFPIVFICKNYFKMDLFFAYILSAFITLLLSYLSYQLYELKFINIGKNLAKLIIKRNLEGAISHA
jgi:peptidoglycan/LPS O-acetylase OafA/YrhL